MKNFVFIFILMLLCTACGSQTKEAALTATGYPNGEVQRITVCYQGEHYLYTGGGFDNPLEDGFEKVGEIKKVDDQEYPKEDFSGTRLEIGQEIYVNQQDISRIFVKYTEGFCVLERVHSTEDKTEVNTEDNIEVRTESNTENNAENNTECIIDQPQETELTVLAVKKMIDQELEVTISNRGNQTIAYGDEYYLEKYEETSETWVRVQPVLESFGFHDIGYEVKAGETMVWTVDHTPIYGELENGDYRIAKKIRTADGEETTAYGGFAVKVVD